MLGESDSLIAMLDVATTALDGPMILTPRRFADTRGSFSEVWNARTMASVGLDFEFTQDNQSISAVAGTIRGLHYQAPPYAQGKLVRCAAGALCDIAVDVRKGSATYGQWTGVDLTAENGRQFWIPPGFLHGFVTRADQTVCLYKCTAVYNPEADGAVCWNDPDLMIDWGIKPDDAILSDRDAAAPKFADWCSPFTEEG